VRNGLIGNMLLERFEVFIDFHKAKLYLKAKKNYNKDFEYDKSGMDCILPMEIPLISTM
jgi:hypothetical protein